MLEFLPESVVLTVEDDGKGFVTEICPGSRQGHFGLLGMSERAKHLNGRILIESAPGKGTRFRAEIPANAAPAPGNADTKAIAEPM